MEKIKLSEIIEKLNAGHFMDSLGIFCEDYIPIVKKRDVINQIVESSLETINGHKCINPFGYELAKTLYTILLYTNIENDIEEDSYDLIIEKRILKFIKGLLDKDEDSRADYKLFEYLLDDAIYNEKTSYNDFTAMISRNIENLISKIPDSKEMSKLLTKLPKALEKISPENLQIIKDLAANKGVK